MQLLPSYLNTQIGGDSWVRWTWLAFVQTFAIHYNTELLMWSTVYTKLVILNPLFPKLCFSNKYNNLIGGFKKIIAITLLNLLFVKECTN